MADLDSRSTANDVARPESSADPGNSTDVPRRNGTADARVGEGEMQTRPSDPPRADSAPHQPGDEHDDRSGLEQAEELVDNLAARVSSLVGAWGRKFLRFTARARESAQDFWAEVQDFRHGKKP
jgi:hypothetical protein